MILENLRIALTSVRGNAMRSILTTLGIIIGVAAVIAVVSIVQGLNFLISSRLQGVGVTFIRVEARPNPFDPDLAGREVTLTYEDGLAVMDKVPNLRYFNPLFFRSERAGPATAASPILWVSGPTTRSSTTTGSNADVSSPSSTSTGTPTRA